MSQYKRSSDRVAQYWNEYTTRFRDKEAGLFWWQAGPEIQKHINRKISGASDVDWTKYTLRKYFVDRLPLKRCLSLGCGNGHLERTLARQGAFENCDAYDVSGDSIRMAQKVAEEEGLTNITYYVADINTITLPRDTYDAVWIASAMHHFERLEHVCQEISQSLKPDGLLVLNEYVGPSRFQFPTRQKQIANLCLHLLPERYRRVVPEQIALDTERIPFAKEGRGVRWFWARLQDKIRDGDLVGVIQRRWRTYHAVLAHKPLVKTEVVFPSVRDVASADPSEAVRSSEIVRALRGQFEIIEKKDWGGNLMQFVLAGIAGNFDDSTGQSLLRMLLEIEDTLLQANEFESDYAYIVARPRKAK